MQAETLEQKTLQDKSTVTLLRRLFPLEIRFDLGIPQTYEFTLQYTAQNSEQLTTPSLASWYVGEEVLRHAYGAIQNRLDYDRICQALKTIKKKEDADRVIQMSDFPLARIIPVAPNGKVSLAHIPPISHRSEHIFS